MKFTRTMIADQVAAQMIRGDVKDGIRIYDRFFTAWKPFNRNIVRPWRAGTLTLPDHLADELKAMVDHPSRAMNFRMMTGFERRAAGIGSRLVVVEPSRAFVSLRDRIVVAMNTAPASPPKDTTRTAAICRALHLARTTHEF